jgi:recombination protein RecR
LLSFLSPPPLSPQALSNAMEGVGHCGRCRNFTEEDLCGICANQDLG